MLYLINFFRTCHSLGPTKATGWDVAATLICWQTASGPEVKMEMKGCSGWSQVFVLCAEPGPCCHRAKALPDSHLYHQTQLSWGLAGAGGPILTSLGMLHEWPWGEGSAKGTRCRCQLGHGFVRLDPHSCCTCPSQGQGTSWWSHPALIQL